jgi:hypothetical protein
MNKPSRRSVVRTGVWAVPAVATAAAAPAFAGSVPCTADVCISPEGSGCKLPGHSNGLPDTYFGYRMLVTFTNHTDTEQTITITDFQISGKEALPNLKGTQVVVPVTGTVHVFIVNSTDSSARSATICYTINGEGPEVICTPVSFPTFKPCKFKQNDADPFDPAADCS